MANMDIVKSKQQLISFYQAVGSPDLNKIGYATYRSDVHNGYFYYYYPK
jgi:hypothetical protein